MIIVYSYLLYEICSPACSREAQILIIILCFDNTYYIA